MRKTVVSGVLIAGLLMAQAAVTPAMAATVDNRAQIRALHEQEKTLRAQLHANPSQTPAILAQIRALRKQERTFRQADMKARMAAEKAARKS